MAKTRTTKWVGVLSVALGLLSSPPAFAQDNERDDSDVKRQSETQQRVDTDAQDNPGSENRTGADAENMEAQGPSGDDAGFGAGAVGMPEEPIPDDNANKPADTD